MPAKQIQERCPTPVIILTAFESFDKGFFTYVIEECCESDTLKEHKMGLVVLRDQEITHDINISKSDRPLQVPVLKL